LLTRRSAPFFFVTLVAWERTLVKSLHTGPRAQSHPDAWRSHLQREAEVCDISGYVLAIKKGNKGWVNPFSQCPLEGLESPSCESMDWSRETASRFTVLLRDPGLCTLVEATLSLFPFQLADIHLCFTLMWGKYRLQIKDFFPFL
jgi:hypothetical protein